MADVIGDDRAQLVLVAALAMATLFVVLALLVNTVIYAGNVATRSDVSESATVVNYRAEAVDAADRVVRHANRNDNGSYDALDRAVRDGVSNWSDAAAAHDAIAGTRTRTVVAGTTNGTRIAQTDADRNFSSPDGNTTWRPALDAGGVRGAFRVDTAELAAVNDANSTADLLADGAFHANLTAAGGNRSLFVYERDDGDAGVTVRTPDGTVRTCRAPGGGTATVDLAAGTFGGEPCRPLGAFVAAEGPFDVAFVESGSVAGTYSVVVDREADSSAVAPDLALDSGSPFYARAVYAANVSVTYRSPRTYYGATAEVPNASA